MIVGVGLRIHELDIRAGDQGILRVDDGARNGTCAHRASDGDGEVIPKWARNKTNRAIRMLRDMGFIDPSTQVVDQSLSTGFQDGERRTGTSTA